jgi:hypothetical protein
MNRVTDQGIWIESDVPLVNSQEWLIPLRLVKAIAEGEPVNLGSVSPRLAGNLETIRDIYAAWIPGRKIPLEFELSSDVAAPGKCVSLFFSGGVDSFYSLIMHRDEVENLILIHGFDIPLAETKTFELALEQAREAARLFSKRLIVAKTNLHWEESSLYIDAPRIPCGWAIYWGAALAAVAYALAPNHRKIYIASSTSYANLHPDGSHPLLDPLWSIEALQIVHDSPESRIDKLCVVVQYPEALSRLRVCWENLGVNNCGLCEKCVRTMLGLRALGVDRCVAFPDTLTPQLVSRQSLSNRCVGYWRELLCAGLPPDLHTAVQSAIHSYETGLPVRTGHFKREVKRWLYALRNAGKTLMSPVDRG